MKASIVINNHNYAEYLGAAVDSALGQRTGCCTEVVVVDDGSTDGSRALLRGYGERIQLVLQDQQGATAAMNRGFAASSGDLVIFLDSDDVLHPDAVEVAAAGFATPSTVKVHWPVEVVDGSGRSRGARLPAAELPSGWLAPLAMSAGPQSLPFPPTSGNAWRRSFLEQVCPLPELEAAIGVGSANADALLSMLALFAGDVSAFDQPLSDYRVHATNDYATSSLSKRVDRHVAVTDLHFEVVHRYCASRGFAVDVASWKEQSYFHRLERVRDALQAAVGPDDRVLLVDDGQWSGLLRVPPFQPFPARDGEYWGSPNDDEAAISSLLGALRDGATHLALARHAQWWATSYPRFWALVQEHSELVLDTREVSVRRLGTDAPAAGRTALDGTGRELAW